MLNPATPAPTEHPAASDSGPVFSGEPARLPMIRDSEPLEPGQRTPVVIHSIGVQPRPIAWLWPGRIAMGKLTLLVGPPGTGKSLLALDMAARVTTGRSWPDNSPSALPPGDVLLVNSLDNPADTLRPRLDAAGADPSRIHILAAVKGEDKRGKFRRPLYLPRDLDLLRVEASHTPDCRLVVVDPTSVCLGPAPLRPADIRHLLFPMADLAHRGHYAVLAVVDVENVGPKTFARTLAALVAANAIRAVYLAAADPEAPDRRLFMAAKNDLVSHAHPLAYRIVAGPNINTAPRIVTGPRSDTAPQCVPAPRIEWDAAPVRASVETALAIPSPDACCPAVAEAEAWLANMLALRPCPAAIVKDQARQDGISVRTLNRAKARLGVIAGPSDFHGPWIWRLPAPSQDRQPVSNCNTAK